MIVTRTAPRTTAPSQAAPPLDPGAGRPRPDRFAAARRPTGPATAAPATARALRAAMPRGLESPSFFRKLLDTLVEIVTLGIARTRTYNEDLTGHGEDALDAAVRRLGEKVLVPLQADPKRTRALFARALELASPGLEPRERADFLDGMMGQLEVYRRARRFATPKGGNAFARLPGTMQRELAGRLDASAYNRLTPPQRLSLACLYAKLRSDGVWGEVGAITWVGNHGELNFRPRGDGEQLRRSLAARGFGDHAFASAGDASWGLRSARTGCQLHFRYGGTRLGEKAEAHLDLNNPGAGLRNLILLGPRHLAEDGTRRTRTHRADALLEALEASGVRVPTPR